VSGARLSCVAACAMLALAGCGYVGDPLPPALNIPVPITDLRAAEIGEQITVEFTVPTLTTEGLPLKQIRGIEIAIGEGGDPFSVEAWAARARHYPLDVFETQTIRQNLAAADWIGKNVVIGARATGPKGKSSAWSNFANLTVISPVATPLALRATDDPRGVALSWQGSAAKYRIYRATGEGKPAPLADADRPEYVDDSINYGTEYRYLVQALASETQQSEVTAPAAITPSDRFPPAVPAGVNAVPAVQTIELAWERNTEPDFASYNVYRSAGGGPFEPISTGLTAPVYSDTRVEPGKRYQYRVSAVDEKGNESAQSPAVEVVAQ
jgi:hypothetical protein